jgi:hypothetical protein
VSAADLQREKFVYLSGWAEQNRSHIGYGTGRPVPHADDTQAQLQALFEKDGEWSPDCSGFYRWMSKNAGFRDPVGTGFADPRVNTELIAANLHKHYTNPRDAHPGAPLVLGTVSFKGKLSKQHICALYERDGDNPWLISHGGAAGPRFVRYQAELAAHPGADHFFCDISGLLLLG